jgi:hypothetical protein
MSLTVEAVVQVQAEAVEIIALGDLEHLARVVQVAIL